MCMRCSAIADSGRLKLAWAGSDVAKGTDMISPAVFDFTRKAKCFILIEQ